VRTMSSGHPEGLSKKEQNAEKKQAEKNALKIKLQEYQVLFLSLLFYAPDPLSPPLFSFSCCCCRCRRRCYCCYLLKEREGRRDGGGDEGGDGSLMTMDVREWFLTCGRCIHRMCGSTRRCGGDPSLGRKRSQSRRFKAHLRMTELPKWP
jgi:hypothetical protein